MDAHEELRARNKGRVARRSSPGASPTLDIDLSLFPIAHTQWMWGQLAAKLVRLGSTTTDARQGRRKNDVQGAADLTEHERRWAPAAEYVMTMSPDVGTSTNISSVLNERIYGPDREDAELGKQLEVKYKHPELVATQDAWTRHIRFEIAEATREGSFREDGPLRGLPSSRPRRSTTSSSNGRSTSSITTSTGAPSS